MFFAYLGSFRGNFQPEKGIVLFEKRAAAGLVILSGAFPRFYLTKILKSQVKITENFRNQ